MKVVLDIAGLDLEVNNSISRIKKTIRMGFERAGEIYATTAKENGSYNNVTGNLRNSNGYGIAEDGVLREIAGNENFERGLKEQDLSGDIVLEAGAGMDYAAAVQAKGYDVTDSGQIAAEIELRRLFR